jgi:hypothetical protein
MKGFGKTIKRMATDITCERMAMCIKGSG